ncbi:TolC family protein [Henriciella mobilis]|uniref:TolC family protein n=1 Tax=Henriciella mobilis TaxID=2305467 RepID=A0A399RQX5_9PROT|nr:TolC family protein [Henriciella mobilis]RIJ32664.1 hypothetical protein D1223_02090 [Henriciella mobilis]
MSWRPTAFLTAVSVLALPAAADPVSLPDAVRQALTVSPGIETAEAGLDAAQAGLAQAKGQRGVTVGAQAQLGASATDFTTGSVNQYPRQVALQAELPLYASGSLASAESAARFGLDSARQMKLGTEESITLQTVQAYANLWLSAEAVAVRKAEVETLRLREEETRANAEEGLATRTDTALAASRLASARARLAGEEAQYEAAKLRFERLTGQPDATPLDIEAISLDLPETRASSLSIAQQNNTGLAAARAALSAARSRESQVRGEFGPKVSLRARASAGEDVYFFFEDPISDIGAFVTVEVPLFTNGVKPAAIDQASAGRRIADATLRDRQMELNESVQAVWFRIIAAEQSLEAAIAAEEAAAIAAEGARREHDLGLRTLTDLLDAEDEYSRAAIAHRAAAADLLVTRASLLALMSGLKDQLLQNG